MGSTPTMSRSGRAQQIDPRELLDTEDTTEKTVPSKKETYSVSELTQETARPVEEKKTSEQEVKAAPVQPEAKLATNKLVVAAPTEKNQPVVSQEVQFIREYIARYIDYVGKLRANPETAIQLFKDVIKFAIDHQNNPDVLNELYNFFKMYKSSILDYTRVMQACTTLRPKTKEQIGVVWVLMTELASGRKSEMNWQRAIDLLEGSGLVDYVHKRMQSFMK